MTRRGPTSPGRAAQPARRARHGRCSRRV